MDEAWRGGSVLCKFRGLVGDLVLDERFGYECVFNT